MTKEEAIKWFEEHTPKNCSECPKEYDHSCSYANSLRCEAYMLARTALRDAEESEMQRQLKHFDIKEPHAARVMQARQDAIEILNFYRNLHYADASGTTSRELADAINEILPHYVSLCEAAGQ